MQLIFNKNVYNFRSRGLFVFLTVLKDAHPNWVSLQDVFIVLPNISPRQVARYIDLLESANLALVAYKTKTLGLYKLNVAPALLDLSKVPLNDKLVQENSVINSRLQIHVGAIEDFLLSDWLVWMLGVMNAHLMLMDGNISEENGALSHLEIALQATDSLPVWTKSVVYLRLAHTLNRQGCSKEAWQQLRKVETLIRQGAAHPAAEMRLPILRAKIRYDQGQYAQAQNLVDSKPANTCATSPQLLNMHALLLGQKCFENTGNAKNLFAMAFTHLVQAIGGVLIWQEDDCLLDALTYNFGNLMLRAVKLGVLHEKYTDTAAQWLISNTIVCRKLGVGEDSVLNYLSLFDISHEYSLNRYSWPKYLKLLSPETSCNQLKLIKFTVAHARKLGNRLELAESLMRKIRLIDDDSLALACYTEAMTLFESKKRYDITESLAREWQKRAVRSQ